MWVKNSSFEYPGCPFVHGTAGRGRHGGAKIGMSPMVKSRAVRNAGVNGAQDLRYPLVN